MKAIIYILLAGLQLLAISSYGQNVPKNTTTLSGPFPGKPTSPKNFNTSPNISPTFYNVDRVFTPLTPRTTIPSFDVINSTHSILINTTYNDGFGQPLMHISYDNLKNIITPFDNRQSKTIVSYLPYYKPLPKAKFVLNPFQKVLEYYGGLYPGEDSTAYSKTKVYASNGVTTSEEYEPGAAFVGKQRSTKTSVHVYGSSEVSSAGSVMVLEYSAGSICYVNDYGAGQLLVTKMEDPHGGITLTYQNRSKQTVCKKVWNGSSSWLTTYYLYNEVGGITFIVTPKATAEIINEDCINSDLINKLCYAYEYDKDGNTVSKRVPGKQGKDIVVYDIRKRAVMTRSPLMATKNQWYFTLYDKLNRPVVTGMYNGNLSQSHWDSAAYGYNASSYNAQQLEYWFTHHLGSNTYPDTLNNCVMHSYSYYDNYLDTPANYTTFDASYATHYRSGSEMIVPVPNYNVHGKLVATRVRILDEGIANNFVNKWVTTVMFYDEQGRVIQTKVKNPWNTSTWDVSTNQYNFAGSVVLNVQYHKAWAGSTKPATTIITRSNYALASGQLESVDQKIDTGAWMNIASYAYEDLPGRLRSKQLGNVEHQRYSYNIRGQLTGISEDVLRTDTIIYPNVTYASQLCYETGFDSARYDGTLTGYKWRTKSSEQRAYGYMYDKVGRMKQAVYRDSSSAHNWSSAFHNFTVSNVNYDANGNITALQQYGPTTSGWGLIDNLVYTYDEGNTLQKTTESTGANVSPSVKDFENGTSGTSDDYTYDADGNLSKDRNKSIDTIIYNHQDLPVLVRKGNDTIRNIYDASGVLLQKTIRESSVVTTRRYWGNMNYKGDSVEYVLHPEGRARWQPDSGLFRYDFFVKDHLGNVRTTVCAYHQLGIWEYSVGFELAHANIEEAVFEQVGVVRDNKPQGTPQDLMSGHLNGADPGKRIGATLLLHGMAGDQIDLSAWAYYENEDVNTMNTYAPPNDMLSALSSTLMGAEGIGGESGLTISTVNSLLSNANYNMYEALKSTATDPNYPRAYLNLLVFDEDMQLLPEESQVVQMRGPASTWTQLHLSSAYQLKRTGYLIMYVSNESAMDVHFDNKSVTHWRGRLLEEQHYYPHGLVIEAGNAGVNPKNNYLHQTKKLQPELGLELYDFHARQYDPQIGRFWGIDPADEFPSGYTGMGNDPANLTDPTGMTVNGTNRIGGNATMQFQANRNNQGFYVRGTGGERVKAPELDNMAFDPRVYEAECVRRADAMASKIRLMEFRSEITKALKTNQPFKILIAKGQNEEGNMYLDREGHLIQGDEMYKIYEEQLSTDLSLAADEMMERVEQMVTALRVFGHGGKGGEDALQQLEKMKKNPPDHPDFEAPKKGNQKVPNPNDRAQKEKGWLDNKGNVWVPTNHRGSHDPHWDVQNPRNGKHQPVYPTNNSMLMGPVDVRKIIGVGQAIQQIDWHQVGENFKDWSIYFIPTMFGVPAVP